MRIKYLILFILFNWLMIPFSFAEDFSIPHELNSGDILSADILNEIFERVRDSKKEITENELLGDWGCNSFIHGGYQRNQSISVVSEWQQDSEDLYTELTDVEISFSDDGDGTYSLMTSAPNPFDATSSSSLNSSFKVRSNLLLFYYTNTTWEIYNIQKISNTRMIFMPVSGNTNPILVCDKQSLPPNGPTLLSVELSGKTVSLTWTDNASDETGYVIYRRDELTGAYNEITTIAANSTSYSETLSSDGTYWYRVQAENDDGHSVGSNVVKVVIGDGDD